MWLPSLLSVEFHLRDCQNHSGREQQVEKIRQCFGKLALCVGPVEAPET